MQHTITEYPSGTLAEVIQAMGANADRSSTARNLRDDRVMRDALSNALSEMGFRHVKLFNTGSAAIALTSTENQILRITNRKLCKNTRPAHPLFLPAIETHEIVAEGKTFYIEILPRVNTKDVTIEHIHRLDKTLKACNLEVRDIYQRGNVALIEVGGHKIPVVLDSELVSVVDPFKPDLSEGTFLMPWLGANGEWLVNRFDTRKEATGLINCEALDRVEKTLTAQGEKSGSQTVAAIRENGFYSEDIYTHYSCARLIVWKKSPRHRFEK